MAIFNLLRLLSKRVCTLESTRHWVDIICLNSRHIYRVLRISRASSKARINGLQTGNVPTANVPL